MAILKNKKKSDGKRPLTKADLNFYKMTGVFAIACVFVLLVLKMQNTAMLHQASGENLARNVEGVLSSVWFTVLSVVALAASVVWFAVGRYKKIDESHRLFSSTNCLAVVLYLAVFVLCFRTFRNPSLGDSMYGFFIMFTVICAGIYCISKFGYPDFTMFSAVTAVNVVAVYLLVYRFEALFIVLKLAIIAASIASVVIFNKKINNMKLSKKRKSSFLVAPAYVSVCLGAVFMFVRYLSTLASYFPMGVEGASESSPALVLGIAKIAAAIDIKVMLMVFVIEYVFFAIVYTLRLIRD